MNWKKTLFKPKWRHKDPQVRAEAVAHDTDPELLDALATIAVSDEAPGVRAAASRRLGDPVLISEALVSETDGEVVDALQARLRSLLVSPAADGPGLERRMQALNHNKQRDLIEAVAAQAPEPELRRAALDRIDRAGFLGDRAIDDPDAELRRHAASRITQHSTLKRVIAATRTTDKQLHQELSARLHQDLLAAGDEAAVLQEAQAICAALEGLRPEDPARHDDTIAALEQRWKALGDAPSAALRTRYETDLARLRQPRPAPSSPPAPADPAPAVEEAPRPEPEPPVKPAASALLSEILAGINGMLDRNKAPTRARVEKLSERWQQAYASLGAPNSEDEKLVRIAAEALQKLSARANTAEEQLARALETARSRMAAMQQALEAGELHRALELRAKLQSSASELSGRREWKQIQSELSGALGRLRELRDWQHWANDKIRKRLIDEMEAIPGAGLHPDAVLDKIKSLQAEWKKLEASEQIPGDRHYAAAPWMWRKFNAAGKQAFDLTKPFLDKRSEVQSRTAEAFRALASDLSGLADSPSPDWNVLNRATADARKALRSLSTVPARERKKIAQSLKSALEGAKAAKQAHFDTIEKEKLKLIREAGQLAHVEDSSEALTRAKSLQAQWKAAGRLWRSRENELWEKFREPIDPLFNALDEAKEHERAEQAERRARQVALCEQLEALLEGDDENLQAQHGRVQGLSEDWHAFRRPDRQLQARFEKALAEFRHREAVWQRAEAQRERARWWAKADLLHECEAKRADGRLTAPVMKKLEQRWENTGDGGSEIDLALDARFASAREGSDATGEDTESTIEAARRVCIVLEFLAGLPSPEDEKETRMQYQVERLSASMTGERERVPALEEARQLEREWLLQACLPDEAHQAFRERVKQAMDKILEE